MRILLDTHVLLWALAKPGRLSAAARAAIEDTGNDILFSAASIWEIAIKAGLGRSDFAIDPETIAREAAEVGFAELPIRSSAAARVAALPGHHRDPFDRLLIAQAMDEPAKLYTADSRLTVYSELVALVDG